PALADAFWGVVEEFLGPLHLVAAAGDRLERRAASPMQDDVADLAGVEIEARVQFAVDHDAAADPGADEDAKHVLGPGGCAAHEFAVGAHADVVLEMNRPAPTRRRHLGQLDVVPVQVGGEADLADARIDLAGDAQADGPDMGAIDAGLLDQVLNGGVDLQEDA